MKLTTDQLVKKLNPIFERKRLGLLCGAGVSISSGIPDALNIARAMLENLKCCEDDISLFLSKNDTDKRGNLPVAFELMIGTLAEKIALTDPKKAFLKLFAENFKAKPNHNHFLFGKLLQKRQLSFIATTNFDTCFEQAAKIAPLSQKVIFPFRKTRGTLIRDTIGSSLVKLHGCMSNPQTIGTTIEQISKRESITNIDNLVEKIFTKDKHATLLILGYSCSDGIGIVPKIKDIGLNTPDSKKVKILYWIYRPGMDHFTWENLHDSKTTPENKNAKDAFRDFKDAVQISGNLDEFVTKVSQKPIIKNSGSFQLKTTVKNEVLTLAAVFQIAGFYDKTIDYLEKFLKKRLGGYQNSL